MNTVALSWNLLQGALVVALGSAVVFGLKTLQRLDRHIPATGARRVASRLRVGDEFPVMFLPPELARRVSTGDALLVNGSPTCGLCRSLIPALPPMSAQYRDVEFVLFTDTDWSPFAGRQTGRLSVVNSKPLIRDIGLSMEPYAIRTRDGKVEDYGVVNNPEHLESLLLSRKST